MIIVNSINNGKESETRNRKSKRVNNSSLSKGTDTNVLTNAEEITVLKNTRIVRVELSNEIPLNSEGNSSHVGSGKWQIAIATSDSNASKRG